MTGAATPLQRAQARALEQIIERTGGRLRLTPQTFRLLAAHGLDRRTATLAVDRLAREERVEVRGHGSGFGQAGGPRPRPAEPTPQRVASLRGSHLARANADVARLP
jgi:hypothetical protein